MCFHVPQDIVSDTTHCGHVQDVVESKIRQMTIKYIFRYASVCFLDSYLIDISHQVHQAHMISDLDTINKAVVGLRVICSSL